jgi:hypothetical protein
MYPYVYVITDRATRQQDIVLKYPLVLEVWRHRDGTYSFRGRRVERREWCELGYRALPVDSSISSCQVSL